MRKKKYKSQSKLGLTYRYSRIHSPLGSISPILGIPCLHFYRLGYIRCLLRLEIRHLCQKALRRDLACLALDGAKLYYLHQDHFRN
jgi:hypothetical protein